MSSGEQFYKSVLDNLYDGIYFVDNERRISYWNRGAELLTGYSEQEALGQSCDSIFMHVDTRGKQLCRLDCPVDQARTDGCKREIESYFHHKDGHLVPVCLRVAPIRGAAGQTVVAVELSDAGSPRHALRQQLEQYQQQALCDPLTGLGNRRYLDIGIRARMEELKRYGWPFGLLFIDIDRFKEINDTHGHEAGDRVIRMVANTMANSIRAFDLVGRWGGEEFVAVLAHVEQEKLATIAERSRRLIEQSHFAHDGTTIGVTVSLGGTLARREDTVESLIDRADRLMYLSKRNGRNGVTLDATVAPG